MNHSKRLCLSFFIDFYFVVTLSSMLKTGCLATFVLVIVTRKLSLYTRMTDS